MGARSRLSTYLIVFLGGQGLGALLWGAVGQWLGVPIALLVATGLLVIGAATMPLNVGTDVGALSPTLANMLVGNGFR